MALLALLETLRTALEAYLFHREPSSSAALSPPVTGERELRASVAAAARAAAGYCSDGNVANRIVTLGFGTLGDREWPLNDGHIPNPNVERVAPGTGYRRVEGNRPGVGKRPRERSPTRNLTIRVFCVAVGTGRWTRRTRRTRS
jgi:hypothetical protein